MKKYLLIFTIVLSSFSFAQQYSKEYLDSVYNQYLQIREGSPIQNAIPNQISSNSIGNEGSVVKCGFGPAIILRLNIDKFSPEQQLILRKILDRPATDTSIVSPKGYFRIHFYKSGSEIPYYNVDSLAIAADSSYDFEVNFMGFPPPPSDNGAGGDNLHDVYIVNLGNEYGETDIDSEIIPGSGRYISYTLIDNDFAGFYTTGINAARVTIAHEYNHTIQVGDYIFRDSDRFFHELTSTSMEIFVYPSIPDYIAYLPTYFYNTDTGFGDQDGYDLGFWNLYLLKNNFDYSIIVRQWELMPQMRALAAINSSLTERGSSFGKEFVKFGVWTYYTNYRAVPGQYFPLASKYPLIHPLSSVSLTPPSRTVSVNTTSATNNFVTFINPTFSDTLDVLVSNIDYQSGVDDPQEMKSFQYTIYNNSTSGNILISPNYSANLSVQNISNWLTSIFLNNKIVNIDTLGIPPKQTLTDYAFPSPFRYNDGFSYLYVPVSKDNDGTAILNIYSISASLIYSNTIQVRNVVNSKTNEVYPVVRWDLSQINKLATGVYIYVTKSKDNVVKGKFVIFNQ